MKKELNPAQVSAILRTLPVGFYLGTRAPVVLDETAPSSFVNMMTREVHVAFRNVAEAFAAAPEVTEEDLEGVIRGLLYHEISHLLLTPGYMPSGRIYNILEDARIEALLANHFHGVNFRDLLRKVCGAPVAPARNLEHFVFNAVRYRVGPAELISKWDSIVRKYCGNPDAKNSTFDAWHMSMDYQRFIAVAEKYFKADGAGKSRKNAGKGEDAPEDGKDAGGAPKGAEDGEGKAGAGKDRKDADGEKDGEDGTGSKPENGDDGKENARAAAGKAEDADESAVPAGILCPGEMIESARAVFSAKLNAFNDPAVSREVSRIIVRATNKRANRSGAFYGYAGRIDPRAVGTRQDFRWMAKSGDDAAGKFDRIALRLVVDKSGSFSRSINAINSLISSLLEVERKMPKAFSLSVVETGDWTRVHDKTEAIRASGGNSFGRGVVESFKKTEKPGWRNITVAVWDGSMSAAAYRESNCRKSAASARNRARNELARQIEIWRDSYNVLNNRDTVIVTDDENRTAFEIGCPNARRKVIDGNYAETFVGEVLKLLGAIL